MYQRNSTKCNRHVRYIGRSKPLKSYQLSKRQWCLIICKICFYTCICTIFVVVPYLVLVELNNKYIYSYYTVHYTPLLENQPYNAKSSNVSTIGYIFYDIAINTISNTHITLNTTTTRRNQSANNNYNNNNTNHTRGRLTDYKYKVKQMRFNLTYDNLYNNISNTNLNLDFKHLIKKYPICDKRINNWNTSQVLGLYNTGTNALRRLITYNCPKLKLIHKWWKHEYISKNTNFYHTNTFQSYLNKQLSSQQSRYTFNYNYNSNYSSYGNVNNVTSNIDDQYKFLYTLLRIHHPTRINSHIPIILIKDPLTWMRSICKASFDIKLWDPCPFGDKKNFKIEIAKTRNFNCGRINCYSCIEEK